jgi:hypothetical protein
MVCSVPSRSSPLFSPCWVLFGEKVNIEVILYIRHYVCFCFTWHYILPSSKSEPYD